VSSIGRLLLREEKWSTWRNTCCGIT